MTSRGVDQRNPNTSAVATFISQTRYEDLPPAVVRAARRAVLDAAGCALGGLATPLHERLVAALTAESGSGPAHSVGGRMRLPVATAALVNAVAINALDFDDTYELGTNPISHPGSSTVAALLAIAPRVPELCLGDLLSAAAVGYEVAIRVARAVQPTQARRDQVWGLGPHQVFGSAAVTARMLGLDLDATVQCLGFAGVHTSVPSVWTAAGWLKDAVGWPAMTGVLAGYLAQGEFAGPRRIFDGRRSYYATVASDRYQPEELVDGLPQRWHLEALSFKPYPVCRWIHPVLDALASMRDRAGVDPDDVEVVDVSGFWELEKLFLRYRPADLVDAQFSLPYACAHVLLNTVPGPDWFTLESLEDHVVAGLAARVSVTTDPAVEAVRAADPTHLRARVTVRLLGGRILSEERGIAHGHPADPMSDSEICAKFVALATPHLGEATARSVARDVFEAPPGAPANVLLGPILASRTPVHPQ